MIPGILPEGQARSWYYNFPVLNIGVRSVSLDYLVGIGEMQVFDKSLLRRVEELASLPEQDRQGILFALDGLLRDAKARMAYQ